mmetsp:Transcript_74028/g.239323  ORF Transcript_74028/g.239323 Transcript_74028/m.239323 type:complete len:220 (-) Transcript_74028:10-669(-)
MLCTPAEQLTDHTAEPLDLCVLEGQLILQGPHRVLPLCHALPGHVLRGSGLLVLLLWPSLTQVRAHRSQASPASWQQAPGSGPRKLHQLVDVELEKFLDIPARSHLGARHRAASVVVARVVLVQLELPRGATRRGRRLRLGAHGHRTRRCGAACRCGSHIRIPQLACMQSALHRALDFSSGPVPLLPAEALLASTVHAAWPVLRCLHLAQGQMRARHAS